MRALAVLAALIFAPYGAFAADTSTPTLTLEQVIERLERHDRELTSLSARFEQRLVVEDTGMSSVVAGTVDFLKPERLRVEHTRPEPQTVVVDGRDIWIHRPSRDQVIQSSLEDWRKADPMINGLLQFGGYAKLLKAYDAALDSSGPRPVLRLTPKKRRKGQADFSLALTLSPSTYLPEATELLAEGMRVTTELKDIRINPKLDEGLFTFVPPAGADVFRDFKPPQL